MPFDLPRAGGPLLDDDGRPLRPTAKKWDEAQPLCVESLETCRATLGSKHPITLVAIKHYGRLLQAQGKPQKAAPLFLEALEVAKAAHGQEHLDTLVLYQSSAEALLDCGKLDQVQDLLGFVETPVLPDLKHGAQYCDLW